MSRSAAVHSRSARSSRSASSGASPGPGAFSRRRADGDISGLFTGQGLAGGEGLVQGLLGLVEPAKVGEHLADGVLAGGQVGAVAPAPGIFLDEPGPRRQSLLPGLELLLGRPRSRPSGQGRGLIGRLLAGDEGLEVGTAAEDRQASSARMCAAVTEPISIDSRRAAIAAAISRSRPGDPRRSGRPGRIAAAARARAQARLYRSPPDFRGWSSIAPAARRNGSAASAFRPWARR